MAEQNYSIEEAHRLRDALLQAEDPVRASLFELRRALRFRREPEQVRSIVMANIYANWSTEQKRKFDGLAPLFSTWRDCFVSYRLQPRFSERHLKHRRLIKTLVAPYQRKSMKEENPVARILAQKLRSENLILFFDDEEFADDFSTVIQIVGRPCECVL